MRATDRLPHALEHMLAPGERISARGVLKHLPDVRAPSSLTRDPVRRAMLEDYRQRQAERQAWTQRARKQSVTRLEVLLADRNRQIAELEHSVQLLVASHRAMVQAVGELAGLPKWKQAFECYEHCLGELDKLGAVSDHEKRSPASPALLARRRPRCPARQGRAEGGGKR